MNIQTQILDDQQARLTVDVEPEKLEEMKHRAAAKIARKIKIPGFRPGKAPYAVILRTVGEATVLEEALELLVDDIYPKVIEESGIDPYGPGRLDKVESMDPPKLEFVVPLAPEVTLGDYRSIRVPYEAPVVTDGDVDEVLKDLQERQAVVEPVERPAEVGDQVSVSFSAVRAAPQEGEDETLIPERSRTTVINAEAEGDEWPFHGFAHQMVGLAAESDKTIEYTYPDDASQEIYRGVQARFDVHVESVKSRTLPELSDEFAGSFGDFENLDALKKVIRQNLETQKLEAYNENYDEEIMKLGVEETVFKIPPQMLDNEVDQVRHDLTHRLERQRLDMDLYMKSRNLDEAGLRAELEPVAIQRLQRSLFLFNLGKAEDIQVSPEELQQETLETMEYLARSMPEKEARKLMQKDVRNNLVGNVLADLISRRSMERFRDICSGKLEAAVTEGTDAAVESDVTESEPVEAAPEPVEVEAEAEAQPAAASETAAPADEPAAE